MKHTLEVEYEQIEAIVQQTLKDALRDYTEGYIDTDPNLYNGLLRVLEFYSTEQEFNEFLEQHTKQLIDNAV